MRARKRKIKWTLTTVVGFVITWILLPLIFGFLLIPNFHEWILASDFPWNILKMLGGGLLAIFLLYLGWVIVSWIRDALRSAGLKN